MNATSTRKPSEVLRAAKERIGTREKLARYGATGPDKYGVVEAYEAVGGDCTDEGYEFLRAAIPEPHECFFCKAVGKNSVTCYVETHPQPLHKEVMDLFDRAIAAAERAEAEGKP